MQKCVSHISNRKILCPKAFSRIITQNRLLRFITSVRAQLSLFYANCIQKQICKKWIPYQFLFHTTRKYHWTRFNIRKWNRVSNAFAPVQSLKNVPDTSLKVEMGTGAKRSIVQLRRKTWHKIRIIVLSVLFYEKF